MGSWAGKGEDRVGRAEGLQARARGVGQIELGAGRGGVRVEGWDGAGEPGFPDVELETRGAGAWGPGGGSGGEPQAGRRGGRSRGLGGVGPRDVDGGVGTGQDPVRGKLSRPSPR